ncbi:flavin reductase family protein [Cupriavidus oxalaticus]|uniref:flavin reductase family protein n=1 Tax=Cupriavidus oxalaticus TaxID=96344 RepID=UPI00317AD415
MSVTALTSNHTRLIEQGNPNTDSRAFRRCLGQYPTGVAVITARHNGKLLGMAVNSFAAVSLDPPLVLWSIRRESASAADFCDAEHLAVNVLSANQVQVSQWFGSAHPDRFQMAAWEPDAHGAPLLDGAIAHLECRRQAVLEGGDHFILLMRVERHASYQGEPLLFAQGQYAATQSHPYVLANREAAATARPSEVDEAPLLRLLSIANQRMSAQFQQHREALGLNTSSTRILNKLGAGACPAEELERLTYLGHEAVEDTLADLDAHGYIAKDATGRFELTHSGRDTNAAIAARSVEFAAQKLQGLPESDVAAAKRVLLALQDR